MTFADLVAGAHVFVDANLLIYHFSPHPVLGPAASSFWRTLRTRRSWDTLPLTWWAKSPMR